MSKLNKSWMAVVAAALLLGALVGVVWARPGEGPHAQATTRKVTLTGADFIPTSPNYEYGNAGEHVYCVTGSCNFSAPVNFPTLSAVTVERIKLHVNDNNATGMASSGLMRAKPPEGTHSSFGQVSSPPGSSGGLQTYTSSAMNKAVWPSQKAYILLYIGSPNINVFGVTVEYHVNS
jgi:hypothetical protein